MGRLGIRVGNAALFVLCTFLAANVLNEIAAELLTPARASVRPPSHSEPVALRTWADRKPILDRNLFGAQLAGDAPPPVEPVQDLEETKLPLRLLGTAASSNPKLSRAAIEDSASKEHEVVAIGDRLEKHSEVQIAAIEARRVVLQNRGRLEELRLEDVENLPQPRRRTARTRPSRRDRPVSRVSDRLQKLRERANSQAGRNTASIFSDARILPKYCSEDVASQVQCNSGEMVGIQLSSIKSGGFFERLGIEDGDIVTQLNDIRIDNPAASAQLLSELAEADEFVFEKIGAGGQPEKFTVPADEVAKVLGDL